MAIETVHVYCYDQATPANLVDGVLVRVYDGASFVTQGYTGDDGTGIVEFGLDGTLTGKDYTIRMSKVGVAFDSSLGDEYKSPQVISIYSPASGSPTGTNDFEVYCDVFDYPSSSDSRLCRCSGYFLKPNGNVIDGLTVTFRNTFNPSIVDGRAVIGGPLYEETDSDGYLSIDLYRNAEYIVNIGKLGVLSMPIKVPNLNGVNLINLILPQVSQIVYSPTSLSLSTGDVDYADVVVTCTDGRSLESLDDGDVEFTSSDTSVATVSIVEGRLRIVGVATGTAEITGDAVDDSVISIPEVSITQTPLSVTVA